MPEPASILIIDDEENLRRSLAMILRHVGYEVITSASVSEARSCLQAGKFNLVFLDLKLPDANGLSLLPEIQHDHPGTAVLILTAHDKLGVAIEAVTHGARDFLLKPIDPTVLIKRVEEVLAEG